MVCRYETITITTTVAMIAESGVTNQNDAAPAADRTIRISSVAYAFDDNGSDANTGSASTFGSNWCGASSVARLRPSNIRLSATNDPGAPLGARRSVRRIDWSFIARSGLP